MKNLYGRRILVTDKESIYYKDWGVVQDIDFENNGYLVTIASYNKNDSSILLDRNQFKMYDLFKKVNCYGDTVYDAEYNDKKYRISRAWLQDGEVYKLMQLNRSTNMYSDTNWSGSGTSESFIKHMTKVIINNMV